MGCFSSKGVREDEYQDAPFSDLHQQPPEQQNQQQQQQPQQLARQQSQQRQSQQQQQQQKEEKRGGLLRSLSKDKRKHGGGGAESAEGQVVRRGVSFANGVHDEPAEGRRISRSVQPRSNSFVGADLHAIMDEHGMLNPMVSRQLSVMSHYSVRSESGSVMITPEQAKAPFRLVRLIGRGGFGNVYLGEWDGEKVAVKVIAGNNSPDLLPEEVEWEGRKERMAQMEAVLMSAIHHPNIVNTYKVTSHSGDDVDADLLLEERRLLANAGGDPESGIPSFEWHILMEYCDKGSLSKMLAAFKLHTPVDNQTVNWNAWTSLEVLKETADALSFLHEHRIIHGDLKAANVLLASSDKDKRGWESKVSDFGLSRVIAADCPVIKTHTFGTVTHMPPELLSKGRLLPSSDVYAFGVLMWEVYTGEKVFKQLSDSEVILAVVTKRARPIFPSDCPSRYRFLAEKCWAEMHELRPSLKHISTELDNLQKKLCPDGPDSEPIPCRVFPTRQRMLDQYRQQIAAQQAQQAAAHHQAHTSLTNGAGNSNVTRQPPRPGVVPLNHQGIQRVQSQSIDKHHKRIYSQDMSPHTHSASEFHKSMGGSPQNSGNLYKPQRSNKSFGASLTKSPLGAMANAGTRTYERAKSLHGHHPDLSSKSRPNDSPHNKNRFRTPSSPQFANQDDASENGAFKGNGPSESIAADTANMPLHPSLINGPTQGSPPPVVGQHPKRPSVLKPSASHKHQQTPSPTQAGPRTSGGVRFEV